MMLVLNLAKRYGFDIEQHLIAWRFKMIDNYGTIELKSTAENLNANQNTSKMLRDLINCEGLFLPTIWVSHVEKYICILKGKRSRC
jgi:hypothetical protein